MAEIGTASDVIGQQVNRLRKDRGWSIRKLAEVCAEAGVGRLTDNALENIEYGRRDKDGRRRREIAVEELLLLAFVLGVHPVDLLVPADLPDDAPFRVAPGVDTTAGTARRWIGGHGFLVEPESIASLFEAMQHMSPARRQELTEAWFTPERRAQHLPQPPEGGEEQDG